MHRLLQGTTFDFRHRVTIAVLILVLTASSVTFLNDPFTRTALWVEYPGCVAVAFVVYLTGVMFRSWATGYLPVEIIHDHRIQTPKLIQTGPFAVTRNPLYIGTFLIFVSVGFVMNFWSLLFLSLGSLLRAVRLATLEEKELLAKFGPEFEQYRSRVPRFVPKSFSALVAALREKSDWMFGLKDTIPALGGLIGYPLLFVFPSLWVLYGSIVVGFIVGRKALRSKSQSS